MFTKESRANPCQEGLVMNGLLMKPRANANTDKKENVRRGGRNRILSIPGTRRGLGKVAGFA